MTSQQGSEKCDNGPDNNFCIANIFSGKYTRLHIHTHTYTVTDRNVGTRYLGAGTHRNVGKIAGNFKMAKTRVKQHYFVTEKLYLASAN
jgi:hypothetical protein